ncbi:MAG: hypothetical protein AB1798_05065 [Spirochaetota bacterium]
MNKRKLKTGVSYFGNRNPRHFIKDVEDIASHNCTFIVHTFSENDQKFYRETLSEFVSLSKQHNLEVYVDPWGVGRVFGGEAESDFALKKRDTCQLFSTGEAAPACCINNPQFRDFMRSWIDEVVTIGGEVVFWDEPHFFIDWERRGSSAERWTCWCMHCREKYERKYGGTLPVELNREMVAFRQDAVIDFLTFLSEYAHSKGLRNALCLLPIKDHRYGLSDWSGAAAIPHLDIIGTDPYWLWFNKSVEEFVGGLSKEIADLSSRFGKEGQIWIQNYKIPGGREGEIREAIDIAFRQGIRNFAAWSYFGTAYMSYIKSDDPKLVWDTLGDAYGNLLTGKAVM